MPTELEDTLHQLKALDLAELNLIQTYARRHKRQQQFYNLPIPIRLAIIHGGLMLGGLGLFPESSPPGSVPIVWAASYCLTLTIVSLQPRHTRTSAHWVR